MIRHLVAAAAAAAALAASVLTAQPSPAAAPAASTTPTLGADQVGPLSSVPWDQVGRNWRLTMLYRGVDPADPSQAATAQALALIDPAGGRYVGTWSAIPKDQAGQYPLDWSPTLREVLLQVPAGRHSDLRAVNLQTGATRTVAMPDDVMSVGFGAGDTLIGQTFSTRRSPQRLITLGWDGTRTVVADNVDALLPDHDANRLIVARADGHNRWRLLDLTTGRVLAAYATQQSCTPIRWWNSSAVLATCSTPAAKSQLRTINAVTGRQHDLTGVRSGQRGDYGDSDARVLGGQLFLEANGPCGYQFLARSTSSGDVVPIKVPHAVGSVQLLGVQKRRLVIEHTMSCDGATPRSVISRFNPATKAERVITKLPKGQVFGQIWTYGEERVLGF